jgi:fibronectin-binding autotransporter adhesin
LYEAVEKMIQVSRIRSRTRRAFVVAAVAALAQVSVASASTLKWDTTVGGDATVTDGTGTWADGTGNFNTGVAPFDHTWSNSADANNIALFGAGGTATGGLTVTVNGTVQAGGITFGPVSGTNPFYSIVAGTGTPKISMPSGAQILFQTGSGNTTGRPTMSVALDANNLNFVTDNSSGAFVTFISGTPAHNLTGTVSIGSNIFIGAAPNLIANASSVSVANGATFVISTGSSWTGTMPLTIAGTGVGNRGAIRWDINSALSMPITLTGSSSTLNPNGASVVGTLNGQVTESAANTPLFVSFGDGTINLANANNNYSGGTTVSRGTLALTSAGKLTATSSITVKPGNANGAVFSFNSVNNAVPSNVALILDTTAGGTGVAKLTTNGKSQSMGTLTILGTATNVIDYTSKTTAATLSFADSSGIAWGGSLKVFNYGGTPLVGGGIQQMIFSNAGLTSAQLSQISFYSDGGTTLLGTGAFATSNPNEVVPAPEPAAIGLLGVASLGLLRRRRRA